MDEPLYSSSWYRVADMKPRLRSHAQIHRHTYRGQDWYVLQDHASGRFHRFTPEAYFIIGLMDSKRTVREIWEAAYARLEDDTPTQDEVISLISQLYRTDVLQSDVIPDIDDLQDRYVRGRRTQWMSYLRSPMAVRFPLLDPDRFLERTEPLAKWLFGQMGLLMWCGVVLPALFLAWVHWDELTSNMTDQVLGLENLLLISLVYPVVKAFHEFGHAYGVKRWGGEVHEMGMMLLVFVPIPYVDASAASAFREKYRRMLVGAAGILVEMFLAAFAMLVWVSVEPGAVRAVAFNVMLIAGVSTLLFNGNPLLRFDAYYILSDYLEIPNLGSRGSGYIGYLVQRYALGITQARSPATTPGEARWLGCYAAVSLVYRIFIIVAICLIAASRFFVLGVLIALWTAFSVLGFSLAHISRYMAANTHIRHKRGRAIVTGTAVICLVAFGVLIVPVPLFTLVEGVVWAPEQSEMRVGVDGFVVNVQAMPGQWVQRNHPLVVCENPELIARARVLEAQLQEVEDRHRAALMEDRSGAKILQDEIDRIGEELRRTRDRLEELVIRSPADGIFLLPRSIDLPNRFLQRGTQLGYVVDFSQTTIRVVVPQSDVSRVRSNTQRVDVRLASAVSKILPASVVREVPEASTDLPSLALSLEGGGEIALVSDESGVPRALERFFQFEVTLLTGPEMNRIGERVFVRFEHDPEPLAFRWYRSIRRLLLRRFDV